MIHYTIVIIQPSHITDRQCGHLRSRTGAGWNEKENPSDVTGSKSFLSSSHFIYILYIHSSYVTSMSSLSMMPQIKWSDNQNKNVLDIMHIIMETWKGNKLKKEITQFHPDTFIFF